MPEENIEKIGEYTRTFGSWFINAAPDLIVCVVAAVAAIVLCKLVPKLVSRIYHRATDDDTALHYFQGVAKGIICVLALLIILDKLGFPISSLLTVIAAVGAAVALAIKDSLSSLAAGIVLIFTKPFRAGDYLEVDGYCGNVSSIRLMHTFIDTLDNDRVAVPNSKMMGSSIRNCSCNGKRRQDIKLSISYGSDIDKAKAVMLEAARAEEGVLSDPEPCAVVTAQKDSSVELALRVWTKPEDYWQVQYSLYENTKKAFDKNGVEIPFPQMDVHIR